MSEPLMDLIREYGNACVSGPDEKERDALVSIEREVAALREQVERYKNADIAREATQRFLDKAEQRIAAVEAERAALMECAAAIDKEVHWGVASEEAVLARDVFDEVPGALAAWMGREGR